jgi:hypothetical protein
MWEECKFWKFMKLKAVLEICLQIMFIYFLTNVQGKHDYTPTFWTRCQGWVLGVLSVRKFEMWAVKWRSHFGCNFWAYARLLWHHWIAVKDHKWIHHKSVLPSATLRQIIVMLTWIMSPHQWHIQCWYFGTVVTHPSVICPRNKSCYVHSMYSSLFLILRGIFIIQR